MIGYPYNITETAKHDSPAELAYDPECPVCGYIEVVWDEDELCWWCCECNRKFNDDLIEIEDGEE